MSVLIRNGTILTPFRKFVGDILIENERIFRICEGICKNRQNDEKG